MASIYIKSGAGGTADGSNWTNAKVDFVTGTSADAAGDIFYVSHLHAESTTGAIVYAFAGTPAAPNRVICGNDGATPPTSYAQTAACTASSNITVTGCVHFSGLILNAGNGGSATQSLLLGGSTSNTQTYKDCSLRLLTTGAGAAYVQCGDESRTDATQINLINTTIRLGASTHRIKVGCNFRWDGGSFVSGGVAPASVFLLSIRGLADFKVSNVDFSANIGTAFHLIQQPSGGNGIRPIFRNCSFPSGWTGNLWSATPAQPGIRASMYNCFVGATKYRIWTWDYQGQTRDNTTVTRTGGAEDDGTAYSIRMVTTADAEFPLFGLESDPIPLYVSSTSSTTVSLEIVHDSQGAGTGGALRNDEIGLRVIYPGGVVETYKTDPLATATDAGVTSSETWTTTGLTTPVKQKLSATFTPTSKGPVLVTPILFTASKTVYFCQKLGA